MNNDNFSSISGVLRIIAETEHQLGVALSMLSELDTLLYREFDLLPQARMILADIVCDFGEHVIPSWGEQ